MADLSDVSAYLAQQAALAIYPSGISAGSIISPAIGFSSPMDVRIYEGWPIPEELEADVLGNKYGTPTPQKRINGPASQVSIFPLPGTGREVYQIYNTRPSILKPPVLGLTASLTGASPTSLNNKVTLTGTPNPGEFVTLIADRAYIFSVTGATAQSILSGLLAQAQTKYPTASLQGPTLTVPVNISLVVNQGGQGLLGRVTHRQCQYVMVTVWAPNRKARSDIASAIDVQIKKTLIATLPDTSEVKIVYDRTTVTDEQQNQSIYRRDLVYDCEYATLETFPGFTITSLTIGISSNFGPQVPANPTLANDIVSS